MLSFQQLSPGLRSTLEERLRHKLADYIQWREKDSFDVENLKRSRDWSMAEVIPYDWIPRAANLNDVDDFIQRRGWHIQIFFRGSPRYYIRALNKADSWSIEWIGEKWLADHVQNGMVWLEEREQELPTSEVKLLSSRLYEFSSFWLVANRQHVVISASQSLTRTLPLFEWLTEQQLANFLKIHFGSSQAGGGIVRGD